MSSPSAESRLFKPVRVGECELAHRLVLPPVTRFRAIEDIHLPVLPMVADYYSQRAAVPGTLLITEATLISPRASGSPNSPGIWTAGQIQAWRAVTDAVHAKGSHIFCQLWHLGRAAIESDLVSKGLDVVGPSALKMPGAGVGNDNPVVPRSMTEDEIHQTIADFSQAARNAIAAGFDGVELHGANGYLLDEFTQSNSNIRTDSWGGDIVNRSRFPLAVAKAVADAVGPQRLGYRISPCSDFQGMHMEKPAPQFTHLISGLRELDLAYLHVVAASVHVGPGSAKPASLEWIMRAWNPSPQDEPKKPIILAGGFTPESAFEFVDEAMPNQNVLIAMGRHWTRNPDLVWRVHEGVPLQKYDRSTFYNAKEARGYSDWAFHPDFKPGVLSASN